MARQRFHPKAALTSSEVMNNIEGLGTFYLGRTYDLAAKKQLDQPILYVVFLD